MHELEVDLTDKVMDAILGTAFLKPNVVACFPERSQHQGRF